MDDEFLKEIWEQFTIEVDEHCSNNEEILIGAFFNAGIRIYDIKNPYQPEEIAYFVPPKPANSRVSAIQMNDVYEMRTE